MVGHIKPGHEKAARATLERMFGAEVGEQIKHGSETTLWDARFVLFDNDMRLFAGSTYEGTWDKYFEDHIASFGYDSPASWNNIFKHCVGLPDEGYRNIEELKDFLAATQEEAVGFGVKIPNHTLKQTQKALKVQAAFQQILDSPDAEAALSHPALAPLLELAAD